MALANAAPLIVELAAKITSSVAELQVGLAAQGLENPSWAENSPPYLPSNLHQLRDEVLDATAELHEVLLEPLMLIYKFAGVSNVVSIDSIVRFKILDMIPLAARPLLKKSPRKRISTRG
uniref:Uncharacterized protein n=1 Tax=Bionectria ochroleuca TaxID=29856 RepID=A0A8H7K5R5_BIOOC